MNFSVDSKPRPYDHQQTRGIYWVRNDLRLHDNEALRAFSEQSSEGLVAWFASASFYRAGPHRKEFILSTLEEFGEGVRVKGSDLIISQTSASEVLPKLVRNHAVDRIYVSAEAAPEERAEEEAVARACDATLIRLHQDSLLHPADLPFDAKDTPEVFTQFRKQVDGITRVREPLSAPLRLPSLWPKAVELTQPPRWVERDRSWLHPKIRAGESAGLARVREYIWETDCLRVYKETRNGMIEWNDSSKFSPWLSIGALSPRLIYSEVARYERERCRNESTYWMYFELLWRDYFRLIVEKKKSKVFGRKPQLTDAEATSLGRWSSAKTGNDFIDANMTELNTTGWMSNRGRQNVASYLAKEMLVPWQYGAEHFERLLIDYDVSSNWGNWAYLSGTGQDPRNRRFNTSLQAELYDRDGLYRKAWLKGFA